MTLSRLLKTTPCTAATNFKKEALPRHLPLPRRAQEHVNAYTGKNARASRLPVVTPLQTTNCLRFAHFQHADRLT